MANFLKGFAQTFGPQLERGISRKQRLDDILAAQTRQDQLLSDQIARQDQLLADQRKRDDRLLEEQIKRQQQAATRADIKGMQKEHTDKIRYQEDRAFRIAGRDAAERQFKTQEARLSGAAEATRAAAKLKSDEAKELVRRGHLATIGAASPEIQEQTIPKGGSMFPSIGDIPWTEDELATAAAKTTRLQKDIIQPTAPERDDAKLDEYADEFDTASPDRQAQIIRKAQTILSKRGDGKWTPEDVTKYLQSGQPPEEVVVPFEETAAERGQREKRLSMLKNMDDLLQTAEKQDWTGLIPGLKSEFFDKILPAGGLDKFANIKRLKFRSELGANAYAMARELLEESRMTDADFQHLRKYTPEEWMEKPEVLAKLRSLNELVRAKLMIQDKRAGKAPLFSLSPVEFFNQMDVPNEKFGGAVTVPSEIAPAVIRNSLTFRYIDGDEKKPVTADYISGLFREGKIDENAGTLWIHYLGLPLK